MTDPASCDDNPFKAPLQRAAQTAALQSFFTPTPAQRHLDERLLALLLAGYKARDPGGTPNGTQRPRDGL